jgi:hypothetical protein
MSLRTSTQLVRLWICIEVDWSESTLFNLAFHLIQRLSHWKTATSHIDIHTLPEFPAPKPCKGGQATYTTPSLSRRTKAGCNYSPPFRRPCCLVPSCKDDFRALGVGQPSHLWPHFKDFAPCLELQLRVLRCEVFHRLLQALMIHGVHISKVGAQAEFVVLHTAPGDGSHPGNPEIS